MGEPKDKIKKEILQIPHALAESYKISSLSLFLSVFELLVYRYTHRAELSIEILLFLPDSDVEKNVIVNINFNKDNFLEEFLLDTDKILTALSFPQINRSSCLQNGSIVFSWNENDIHFPHTLDEKKGAGISMSVHFLDDKYFTLTFFTSDSDSFFSPYTDYHKHTQNLISHLANYSNVLIGSIQILGHEEKEALINWSYHDAEEPEILEPGLLHELFESQIAHTPDFIAIDFEGEKWNYTFLDHYSNKIARYLRSKGIGKNSRVGILTEKCPQLYAFILGILKAGAAYVPLEPSYPQDILEYISTDCKLDLLLSFSKFKPKLEDFKFPVVYFDLSKDEIETFSYLPINKKITGVTPEDLCYIVYTSGSTGNPKGVLIQHKNICHLVKAEKKIFKVTPQDRVYQGLSIAFDAALEEIWLAFNSGATLVPATKKMNKAGHLLPLLLTEARITVLSTVPTLLTMIQDDLPSVRILILGGENCPQELAYKWCKEGRRLFNTYGPTEATVIATYSEFCTTKRISIGKPISNYSVFILDEEMQLSPIGVNNEIWIGGPGIAIGYLNQQKLTEERFLLVKLIEGKPAMRLYKTGDIGHYNQDGDIEYFGRKDTQVKIHGFRVELGQIESALLQCKEVDHSVVILREDSPGIKELTAYVTIRKGENWDEKSVLEQLQNHLPFYMIPTSFCCLDTIPVKLSGKIDYKKLPEQSQKKVLSSSENPESVLVEIWEKMFFPKKVGLQDDFFLDANGHSLHAAHTVSELRKNKPWRNISILDIYNHPNIESLAKRLNQISKESLAISIGEEEIKEPSFLSHKICALFQFLSLYLILGFNSLQWITPYITFTLLIDSKTPIVTSLLFAFSSMLFVYPLMLLLGLVSKWVIIGRYKPGKYPIWGLYFFRWWLVDKILSHIPLDYMAGSSLINIYFRLLGAKIGPNVHIETDQLSIFDLISIGQDTSINTESTLSGYKVEKGHLVIGPISIGKRCYVGTRSTIQINTTIEDDVTIKDLTLISSGKTLKSGTQWYGSPAQEEKRSHAQVKQKDEAPIYIPTEKEKWIYNSLQALILLIFPLFPLFAIFPGIIFLDYMEMTIKSYWYLALSPLVALTFVALLALEIVAIKWLVLGRVNPGFYKIHSFFYLKLWFINQLMKLSLDILGPLYATLYLTPWYKMLGVKLGKNAEISTASHVSPDLLEVCEDSFIADNVNLGAPTVSRGYIHLNNISIGKKTFIGNEAVIQSGTKIGENCLVGCLSQAPEDPNETTQCNASWLGSPPRSLPNRQVDVKFSEKVTFKPSKKLLLIRIFIEYFRITLPSTFFVLLITILFATIRTMRGSMTLWQIAPLFPLLFFATGLCAVAIQVLFKWILIGKYKRAEYPLWCPFVWKTELINMLSDHLADPFLISTVTGTPFVALWFRSLGAKIGSKVYMETTDLTEFDLVKIEDNANLLECTIQTHLFEDRVMKISHVHIGPNCNVGAGTLVLYDTVMEEGSSLNDLSLLMKGEVLPPWTSWEGSPCKPM